LKLVWDYLRVVIDFDSALSFAAALKWIENNKIDSRQFRIGILFNCSSTVDLSSFFSEIDKVYEKQSVKANSINSTNTPNPKNDSSSNLSLETLAIRADDKIEKSSDVAPPIHVSTTFHSGSEFIYSRSSQPTRRYCLLERE